MDRMGLKTGIKNFVKFKTFKGIMNHLMTHKTFKDKIPKNYVESVLKVRNLFLYQTVYDPFTRKCKPLNDLPSDFEVDQTFLGNFIPEDKIELYVKGLLNKYTMEPREIYDPDVKRIQDDMRNNDINQNTFYYLNKKFDFTKKQVEGKDDEEDKQEANRQGKSCIGSTRQSGLYRDPFAGQALHCVHHRRRP